MSMHRQYFEEDRKLFEEYGYECALLMRNGAFYELYGLIEGKDEFGDWIFNETIGVGRVLDVFKITDKIGIKNSTYEGKTVCMWGVPIKQLEKHVNDLIDCDYDVRLIHQDSDPNNPGKKIRVRTELRSSAINVPTLSLSNKPKNTNVYITCISCYPKKVISNKDVSLSIFCANTITGEIKGTTITIANPIEQNSWNVLPEILSKYPTTLYLLCVPEDCKLTNLSIFKKTKYKRLSREFSLNKAQRFFSEIFNVKTLPYPNSHFSTPHHCLFKLLDYIKKQNSDLLKHLEKPTNMEIENSVYLINTPLIQLCITPSTMYKDLASTQMTKVRSVFNLLDHTKTMMGKRLLHRQITTPIYNTTELNTRFSRITAFQNHYKELRKLITSMPDMLILHNSLHQNKIMSRPLIYRYRTYMRRILKVNEYIKSNVNNSWIDYNKIKHICNTIITALETTFQFYDNEFTVDLKEKVDKDYDKIKKIVLNFKDNTNDICLHLSKQIKDKTKSKNGKVVFVNKCFFELTKNRYNKYIKPYLDKTRVDYTLPDETKINFSDYEATSGRKKGTVYIKFNSELFSNLDDDYEVILEQSLNQHIREFISNLIVIPELNSLHDFIAEIDVYCNSCKIIDDYHYCIPIIDESSSKSFFSSKKMRHPIIEQLDDGITYVPNDITFNNQTPNMLLYGVNESGKSSLMKSCGINLILAQCGFPVACSEFKFYPYKKIATRILARDNIWAGESTFKVEALELQRIINNSSDSMFVLADELCSGTEIESAQMLVKTSIDYLNKNNSHFLFTTHLHEIKNYDSVIEKVRICDIPIIRNEDGSLIYPHKLQKSIANTLYGIMVATQLPFDGDFLSMLEDNKKKFITNHKNTQTCSYNKNTVMHKCMACGKESNHLETDHIIEQQTAVNSIITNEHGVKQSMNKTDNLAHICRDCHLKKTKGDISWKFVNTSKGRVLKVYKTKKTIDLNDYKYSPN